MNNSSDKQPDYTPENARRGSSSRLFSVWRRPRFPALYEVWGTPEAVAKFNLELGTAIETLGKTNNRIAILCCDGVAHVVGASDPMRRVIVITGNIRPAGGKATFGRQIAQWIKETDLYEQQLGVRIVRNISNLIRGFGKWLHRTFAQKQGGQR